MKKLNGNSKPSSLWLTGIMVLSLSIGLQGFLQGCGKEGANDLLAQRPDNEFSIELANRVDISIPDRSKKGKDILYAAVFKKQTEKVKEILNRIKKDKDKESNFEYSNKYFPNSFGPDDKTPLGVAIQKGLLDIVQFLAKSEHIDINKAKKSSTSLLEAIIYKKKDITNYLLTLPDIDISTKDVASGNTPLHIAILNEWTDVAQKLIAKLHKEIPDLLFAQNKKKETPLHLAMAYKLPTVQDALIKLVAKEEEHKLWIKNEEGNNVVYVAIHNDQKFGISLIEQLPLKELLTKNKKGKTLLHKAAHKNHLDAFKAILRRINKLSGTDEVVKQLFEKATDEKSVGKSVWQFIYLSQHGLQPQFSDTNIEMFRYAITAVKDNLKAVDQNAILGEINRQETEYRGRISKKYADKLRKIVNDAMPAATVGL